LVLKKKPMIVLSTPVRIPMGDPSDRSHYKQSFGLDVSDGLVCMWLKILGCVIDFFVIKMDVGVRSC